MGTYIHVNILILNLKCNNNIFKVCVNQTSIRRNESLYTSKLGYFIYFNVINKLKFCINKFLVCHSLPPATKKGGEIRDGQRYLYETVY